ncbi:SGNH/GDSL hydrolase family protein [Pseudarthrobacter sp. BRE9]|uniref:SGNH/GDSL hydrolase family protein n=1 Tax=Pseudarthrobacter sp. BRE9 TaxID=2962582 RepID=UPI0028810390|nr:SGNH/GDSL hydrolase family protein [Pseudarthrobacter sp. BRE9]MDT0168452.1 SGNH/GDSL hydrolase family protein [Pseudarthrobacter sp. BRE9]
MLIGVAIVSVVYVGFVPAAHQSSVSEWTPDKELTIVAMGDSYMSGEGAEAFLVGTDGPDNKCRQAAHAYPFRVAQELRAELVFVPCSGAVVENIASAAEPGILTPAPHPRSDGRQQIEALKEHPDAELVLLSVGGNDARFAEIISMCMGINHQCSDAGGMWLENLRQVIMPRLELLLHEIRATAPRARILVMTYPSPLAAQQMECASIGLSESEIGFVARFVDTLKRHIDQAAIEAGAESIDLTGAFDGFGLCSDSTTPAINGWHPQKPAVMTLDPVDVVRGSFHPTAYGHRLMAERILAHLDTFRPTPGEVPPIPPTATGVPPDETGSPWSRYGLPPNDCTPAVNGKESLESDDPSLDLRGAWPGTTLCYRIGNDRFSRAVVDVDGTVQLEFSRPPVLGESGRRQIIYQRADGGWWLLEVNSSMNAPPPEVDLISAWFGGKPQLVFSGVGACLALTLMGAVVLWFIRWLGRRSKRLLERG